MHLRDPAAAGSESRRAYYAYRGAYVGEAPDSTAAGPRSACEVSTLGLTFSLPDPLCMTLETGYNPQAIMTRAPVLATAYP